MVTLPLCRPALIVVLLIVLVPVRPVVAVLLTIVISSGSSNQVPTFPCGANSLGATLMFTTSPDVSTVPPFPSNSPPRAVSVAALVVVLADQSTIDPPFPISVASASITEAESRERSCACERSEPSCGPPPICTTPPPAGPATVMYAEARSTSPPVIATFPPVVAGVVEEALMVPETCTCPPPPLIRTLPAWIVPVWRIASEYGSPAASAEVRISFVDDAEFPDAGTTAGT